MQTFPIEKLKPHKAILTQNGFGDPCIQIAFEPFSIPDGEEVLELNSPLHIDLPEVLNTDLGNLQNQEFSFPVNPEEGYIDASIYFYNAHNPVDITKIKFGALVENTLMMDITSRWLMSFEGTGFEDFDLTFSVKLSHP